MLKAIHFDRENLGQLFTKKFLIVILISIPSAIIADFLNIPLAWMIGPMIATSLIALNGFQVLMPKIALSSILIILGLHIGNYIDQNLFSLMVNWIWTTVIMFFYIIVSILIVSKYLQKFSGYKEKTSISFHKKLLKQALIQLAKLICFMGYVFPKKAEYQVFLASKK